MKMKERCLRKRDVGALIVCVVALVSSFGAVGQEGRRRAKAMVCLSNLRQWNNIFQDYRQQNDGQFFTGVNDFGHWWPLQLDQAYKDWKRNRTWLCPRARRPAADEYGNYSHESPVFLAWGIYHTDTGRYSTGPNGIAGSYGLNGYTIATPSQSSFEGGIPATNGWRDLDAVTEAETVPLFLDALRFDLWPRHTDGPAPSESAPWSNNHLARCAINRHDGAVNCLFLDGSARKVGLKELWTLKWYRSFNIAGPWTVAGGVRPSDWPQWMGDFKAY